LINRRRTTNKKELRKGIKITNTEVEEKEKRKGKQKTKGKE
jgi:hypothetical protein